MLEIHSMPGHLIRRLNQISIAVFAARMAEEGHDITPVQFAALSAIRANPGIDQASLASLIAHDRVTIGGVVDRLVHKRLVDRAVSARDRRARELHLAEEGEVLLGRLLPVVRALQDDILPGLTAAERDMLLSLLKKTTQAGNTLSRAPLRVLADAK